MTNLNLDEFLQLSAFEHWAGQMVDGGDARRLFHGRGQCYPGYEWLTVDWFSPLLWLVLYREPPETFWSAFCDHLKSCFGGELACAMVQHRYQPDTPVECLWGRLPEAPIVAREQGLCFLLAPGRQQNIGYFMDMAPTRRWLQGVARERRVLNLFSYTCAFSVSALAAGAESVVNIDMSKASLARGRENHRLNGQPLEPVRFLGHDILKSWGKLGKLGPYDIIICDPPSRQKGSFDAERDYQKLIRRMPELCAPAASVLFCLNAPWLGEAFLREQVAAFWPEAQFEARLPGREDFPEKGADGALKVLRYRAPA